MKKKYVVGFAFYENEVLLIYKTKGPDYVVGTWNGVGGKIEEFELAQDAMAREFFEETLIKTVSSDWDYFAKLNGFMFELHCYSIRFEEKITSQNVETLGEIVEWKRFYFSEMTPNLKWLIPLALDKTTGFVEIIE